MTGEYYSGHKIPDGKKVTCKICHMCDHMGSYYPSGLDSDVHKGFTIGKGKALYWEIIWHASGHCTVYSIETGSSRWISGDQEITIHFK